MERNVSSVAAVLAGVACLVSGCTTTPVNTEADFGNSVRAMVAAQRHEPETTGEPVGMDGQKAEVVLKTYRESIGKPQELKREVASQFGR